MTYDLKRRVVMSILIVLVLFSTNSHVKSGYSRTIIKHSPFSPHTRHLRRDINSCAIFTIYPNCIMKWHPTPFKVITHQSAGGRSNRTQKPSKNACVKLNHLHMHKGSPHITLVAAVVQYL